MKSCTTAAALILAALAGRPTSYLNGYFANPQYKANIIYGLATYRF